MYVQLGNLYKSNRTSLLGCPNGPGVIDRLDFTNVERALHFKG